MAPSRSTRSDTLLPYTTLCLSDLGSAGDHFCLRVGAVQQFGDPYLTDVLAAVAWTAGPRMPDTALVPDHIQHLPDLGAVGLPDADHERLAPLLQHLAAHQDVVAEPALARGFAARQCEGECECAHQRQCGDTAGGIGTWRSEERRVGQ